MHFCISCTLLLKEQGNNSTFVQEVCMCVCVNMMFILKGWILPVFRGGKLHLLQQGLSLFTRNEAEGGSFVNGRESFTSLLKKFIVSLCGAWFYFSIIIFIVFCQMEEPPTESVMNTYMYAQGQNCTFSDFWINRVDIFLRRRPCLLVLSHPKKGAEGGNAGGYMMLFANWKKPVKLTTAAVLFFPLCAQAGIRRGHRELQCGTACIWQAESDTQCAECQFVKYPKWGTAEQRDAEGAALSSCSGRSLPLQARHFSRKPPRYWAAHPSVPEHLKDLVLPSFPSTPVLEVSVGVSLPTVNQSRRGAGATSLHCEDRELCPGSLLFASKYHAVLLHSIN